MNFILNEKNFVEDVIDGIADSDIICTTSLNYMITMFAKYYLLFGGDDEEYMSIIASSKNVSFYKVYSLFDKKVKMFNSKECSLREKDRIEITDNELEQIAKIDNRKCRKLMFTFLVLSKFYDNQWINLKFSEIFKLSNLPITVNERAQLLKKLISEKYISMNNYSSDLSIKVEIEQGKGEKKAYITEINDLGKKYLTFSENKMMCKRCGRIIVKTIHNRLYCKNCKLEIDRLACRNNYKKRKMEEKSQ